MYRFLSSTLFCGDLFTQAGHQHDPLTKEDFLAPSEIMRSGTDYHSAAIHGRKLAEKLAATNPSVLACMHGSSWEGDGAEMLRALGKALGQEAHP